MISLWPSKDDFRCLRPQLRFAFLATLAGLALLAVAVQLHGQERSRALSAKTEGEDLRQRIDHFASTEAELRDEVRDYKAWARRGILGSLQRGQRGQRVQWIRTMEEIRRRRHIESLHYEFSPEQVFGLPGATPIDMPFHFVTSPMKLTATARHEGGVIGLLEDIGEAPSAYVRPHRCVLERKHDEQSAAASVLQLDCQMDWITLSRAP